MKPLARLTWQLLHWPALLALLLPCAVFAFRVSGGAPSRSDALNAIIYTSVLVGGRILGITGLRNLRLLPNGHRLMVRALAILTLLGSLTFGGAAATIGMRHFTDEPTANLALVFILLSGLSFLFFTRGLRGPAKLIAVLGIFGTTACVLAASAWLPVSWCWLASAGYLTLWVLALRTHDVPRDGFKTAVDGRGDEVLSWFARLQTRILLARTPAASLLSAGHAMFARLPEAIGLILFWVVISHVAFGLRTSAQVNPMAPTLVACAVAAVALGQSWVTPAHARRLWLLCGASRTGVFRLAEGSLLANVAVLSVVSWLAFNGIAMLRGIPIGGAEALLTLTGVLSGALSPIYLGLILPTLNRSWQRIAVGTLAGLITVFGPAWLMHVAVAGAIDGEYFPSAVSIGIFVACGGLLRSVAIQRWKKIDWLTVRFESSLTAA